MNIDFRHLMNQKTATGDPSDLGIADSKFTKLPAFDAACRFRKESGLTAIGFRFALDPTYPRKKEGRDSSTGPETRVSGKVEAFEH